MKTQTRFCSVFLSLTFVEAWSQSSKNYLNPADYLISLSLFLSHTHTHTLLPPLPKVNILHTESFKVTMCRGQPSTFMALCHLHPSCQPQSHNSFMSEQRLTNS